MSEPLRSPKLRPWHLDRVAVVYVRRSTPQQVLDHRESTARQYALADRAVALGWARDRVTTIDDDLGKSGQSIEGRPGFQRLLAEVALDHVGLILGLEMSRLARSCRDWHQLLELCGRYRVLLADADGVYDPTDHSDRLLLGLHGVMNEAELHVLKQRMYQGKLNKARRGELLSTPPIGYVRLATGEWAIDPDEQVQAVVRLVFDQFDREATMHGLLRYLVHHQVRIPVRIRGGPSKGQLEWRRPNRATLQNLLRHPSYAGAYRFGHRPTDPRKKQPGRPTTGELIRRPEECLVLIRDRLPAYISWDRFEADQRRLTANRNLPGTPGAPRNGPVVLAGLVRCGRCSRRMVVRYSGPKNRPSYTCTRGSADYAEPLCQGLSSGTALDDLVARQLLAAEEALKARRQLDDEYGRFVRSAPAALSDTALSSIRALAADLPAVWSASTTTPADRQRIARRLLERVVVTVDKTSERVDVRLHWVGSAVGSHTLTRSVRRYDQHSDYPRLVERLRQLCGHRQTAAEIARRLTAEGFHPPKRTDRFTRDMVLRLIGQLGFHRREPPGSRVGLGRDEYRPGGLAARLGINRDTVRRWVKVKWVNVRRDENHHRVIWADADELRRLRALHQLPRTWAYKARLSELKKPKPRPAR